MNVDQCQIRQQHEIPNKESGDLHRPARLVNLRNDSRFFSDHANCLMRFVSSLTMLITFFVDNVSAEGNKSKPIRIGSKALTEGVILGEMLALLSEHSGYESKHLAAMGGTQIVFQALENGSIDAYADYTGTLTQEILKSERIRDERGMRDALAFRGIGMTNKLGFNNTYALGMKEDLAEKLSIRTISELARHPKLDFGFSNEFKGREDGWLGLKRTYQLPQEPLGMDHDIAYRGLESGTIQVTDLNSTDADIRFYQLRVLKDDRSFFPAYQCVILYRLAIEAQHPDVVNSWRQLEDRFDDASMMEMNARVKLDRQSERQVASTALGERLQITIAPESTSHRLFWDLLRNTRDHLQLVTLSLLAAVIVAIPLGIAAAKLPRFGHVILGVIGVMQTIPSMAILVFMIPLLGIGFWPAIAALFLYSLLPIVRNTYQGLTSIPHSLQESAAVLGLEPFARLRLLELPLASPMILAGIKTAAVINVGTATIGVLIGAGGYGEPILNGVRLNNHNMILQGAIPAAVLAIVIQALFDRFEKWYVPEGLRTKT